MLGLLLGHGVGLPNTYVGEREGTLLPLTLTLSSLPINLLDNDGYGVGLPAKYEGTTDGDTLGPEVGLQLGSGVGDPAT